jgi:hypothetical protein
MSQSKRKVLTIDEQDLEWINPMLVEWEKENEGKRQGDLIVQLLKDYREDETPSRFEVKTIESKVRSRFEQLREKLTTQYKMFGVKMRAFSDQMKQKMRETKNRLDEFQKTTREKVQDQIDSRKNK